MKRSRWFALALVLGMAALAVACAPTAAPTPTPVPKPKAEAPTATPVPKPTPTPEPPYYAGKTIRYIIGVSPGGGYDTYTRLIARHLPKHIPGSPTVVVENMPGAGSLVAANHIYKVAKPDGLTVGVWVGGLVLQQILGGEGIEFDARKFAWIGSPVAGTPLCAARVESGFKTINDAIGAPKPLILGGMAPGAVTDDWAKVLQEALGLNIKLVTGYGGTSDIRRAADAGEIHGGCWTWESIKSTWRDAIKEGKINFLAQVTSKKHPDLPEVPQATELAKTPAARQMIDVGIIATSRINQIHGAPPGTPPERVKILREAFLKALKDPELVAEAQKAQLDIIPVSGEEIDKIVADMFNTPPEVVAAMKKILVPQ